MGEVTVIQAVEAAMVSENSGIKDKKKLRQYLYNNPTKLALKLAQFLKDSSNSLLPLVRLKGKGGGYFYSINDKKLIYAARNAEYYLLPWLDEEGEGKCYIYGHHMWFTGVIFKVFKDEIEIIGLN